jgi:hypothetical protein
MLRCHLGYGTPASARARGSSHCINSLASPDPQGRRRVSRDRSDALHHQFLYAVAAHDSARHPQLACTPDARADGPNQRRWRLRRVPTRAQRRVDGRSCRLA